MKIFVLIVMLLSGDNSVLLKKDFPTIEECVKEGQRLNNEYKSNIQILGCYEGWET